MHIIHISIIHVLLYIKALTLTIIVYTLFALYMHNSLTT